MFEKVCYVTTVPDTFRIFMLDSAKYNIEKGSWEVTLISAYDEKLAEALPENIKYYSIPIQRGYNFSDIGCFFQILKIIKHERFDLVEYATTKASFYASLAARLAHIPIRLYGQLGISYSFYTGIRKKVVKTIEKFICHQSTHVYGVCHENLSTAISDGLFDEKKGFVVGRGSSLGVDLNRFDLDKKQQWRTEIRSCYGINETDFLFGYVGMLRKEKGLCELFEAAEQIIKEYDDVKLMIVGDTKVVEGIDKSIINRAINNRCIIFTGKQCDVEKYYAAMDCFVFPSWHEGFGNVTIEAEAMGIPVVATNIPGTREAMVNKVTGVLVPPQNSNELKKAMLTMKDREELRRYSENGRRYVEKYFDKNKLCELIWESRKKLLEKKNGQ